MIIQNFKSYKEFNKITQFPSHWGKVRLKDIGFLQNGISKSKEYFGSGYPFVSYGNVYNNTINLKSITQLANSTIADQKLYSVKKGDVFFTRTSETIDEIGISSTSLNTIPKATFSGFTIRLRPKKYIIKEYSKYYFRAKINRDLLSREISLVTRASLSQGTLYNLSVIIPPKPEQLQIAQYLDQKTTAIDKKIELLQQKAEKYKELRVSIINQAVTKGLNKDVELKETGINFIGQIPKHWEVKRFKDVVLKYTTGGTPSTSKSAYFNGNNIWITISDIGESDLVSTSSLFLTDDAIKDANIVKTPKGSLLYSFKLSIGKMAFTTVDCYTNEAILSIFPNKNIDLKYYYMMLPKYLMLAAKENIYGAKMLNKKLITNAFILHPPKQEQTEISSYLNDKTQTIDKIVGNIKTQIDTLKELKTTLINDVVTGKIKVTDTDA